MNTSMPRFIFGKPLEFVATRQFSMGSSGMSLQAGDVLLYDGTTITFEGATFTDPKLKGAVKAGWLVLSADYENYQAEAVSANIAVRHPTGQAGRAALPTTVSEDERIVGNTSRHATNTRTANTSYVRGQTQVNTGGGNVIKTQRGTMQVESQDGVVVNRQPFKTQAGEAAKNTWVNAEAASEVINDMSRVQIEPVEGVSREEMMSRMSDEERENYYAEINARSSGYRDDAIAHGAVAPSARKVGRVASMPVQNGDGIATKLSVGGGVEIADPTGLGGKPVENTFEMEGIRFSTTNGSLRDVPKPKPTTSQPQPRTQNVTSNLHPDVRRSVAKALCPDFPDLYDFAQTPTKKLARIVADFEERPDVIKAIFAAETDDFKGLLVEQFPSVFQLCFSHR